MQRVIFITLPLILGYLVTLLVVYRHSESKGKVEGYWRIEEIIADNKTVIDDFGILSISFMDNDKVSLPKKWSYDGAFPIRYSTWDYSRSGFFNGQVTIRDINQGYFDGTYSIEIIENYRPELLRLSSDSIDLYLRGVLGFTDGLMTVPIDWLEGTERDPRHPKNREVKSDSTSMEDSE